MTGFMDETIYKIAIATYLYDIGKFAQRASGNSEGKAVYAAAFIDYNEKLLPKQLFNKDEWGLGDSFMNLAAKHHNPETPMEWIIAMADRVSSGFDHDKFEGHNHEINISAQKKTRLFTIFEGIDTNGNWEKGDNLEAYDFRYPLKELSPQNIFPINKEEIRSIDSEQVVNEYNELFSNFVDSLKKLIYNQNTHLWFEHFDSLFMIYASHIPAATVGKVMPDVSLYDHSKATSALASAIYLYHKQNESLSIEHIKDYEDKKFLIISGDFYGIQNFIFAEGGATNKASAKLLRGRSFYVSLLSELAADMFCREIGLTTSSIILNAAGKFTILAPNTDETKNKIVAVEERINKWLIEQFYGEVSIGISSIEASYKDFASEGFDTLLEKIAKVSGRKKYNKINLEKYGGVVENYLDQFNNTLDKKLCPFCGKRPSSPDVENKSLPGNEKSACKICRDHIYIGTNLVRTSKIAITTKDAEIYGDKLLEPIFDYYQVSLDVSGKLIELADKGTLLKYWDISISKDGVISKDITAKFISGYVPKYREEDNYDERLLAGRKREETKLELIEALKPGEETPKTFLHIAKKSLNPTDKPDKFCGIEALSVLKADIDNLGLIFACGIKHNSLSKLATLSRQIDHYFSIYLPYVLSTTEEFKDIYTVFAGGDDLFLIGPWNKIIDFATFLNERFSKYVCGNKQITLSAGISINKPNEPVLLIAQRSEHALKKSKNNERDSITLFDEPLKWKKFEELIGIEKTIDNWIDNEYINNAMLFRWDTLFSMAKQAKEILDAKKGIDMEDWDCLKWRAMFYYNLVRNVGKDFEKEKKAKAIEEVKEKAIVWFENYGGAMKIPLWQIIYNRRKGG